MLARRATVSMSHAPTLSIGGRTPLQPLMCASRFSLVVVTSTVAGGSFRDGEVLSACRGSIGGYQGSTVAAATTRETMTTTPAKKASLLESMALGGMAASFAVNFTHPIVRGQALRSAPNDRV